jgi:hypothetical protein
LPSNYLSEAPNRDFQPFLTEFFRTGHKPKFQPPAAQFPGAGHTPLDCYQIAESLK